MLGNPGGYGTVYEYASRDHRGGKIESKEIEDYINLI